MNHNIDVDLSRASRIARRVELGNIIMLSIDAGIESWVHGGALVPVVRPACDAMVHGGAVSVTCKYSFEARSGEKKVAGAEISYLLLYEIRGDEDCDQEDLRHFANANGIYHSWPFLRQTLFDLTAKMDLPPFKLPVMYFGSRKAQAEETNKAKGSEKSEGREVETSNRKKGTSSPRSKGVKKVAAQRPK